MLVMPALQQGNLLVCAAVKENLTRKCAVGSCASIYLFCVRLVKLVKEKIVILLSYTRANKTRQGKLVRRTHEQVNSSRKLTCQGKLARLYEHRGKTSAHAPN